MFNKLIANRNRRNTRGFTLIELLVVVLILSILMSVALPLYLNATQDAQRKTCRANMQTIASAEQAFKVSDPSRQYTTDLTKLKDLQGPPKCPENGSYTVALNGDGSLTVNCSLAGHNSNGAGGTGFTPGKDNQ
jgi:type IV pilus assembly protein PilA